MMAGIALYNDDDDEARCLSRLAGKVKEGTGESGRVRKCSYERSIFV